MDVGFKVSMGELHSPGALLRARWEDLHSDTMFCRQSNITTDLTSQTSNVGGFLVSIPTYSCTATSASCGNGHVNPTMCSSFAGQLPYIPIVNNHILSEMPYKQGSNITTEQTAAQPNENRVNGHEANVNVSQVLVELERERQKNAELLGRLSSLEAQLQGKDNFFEITLDQPVFCESEMTLAPRFFEVVSQ
eukprot:Gb_12774 [translate_table: standard]